jgi:hypothetical protein
MDEITLSEDGTFDSDQISSVGLVSGGQPVPAGRDRPYWWTFTPTEVLDLTFDLDDTVPFDWVPTIDPTTDVEADPPPVDARLTLYTGTSVNNLSVVTSGPTITPAGLAVGTTYYVQASIPTGDPDVLYQLSVGPKASTELYLMELEVLSGPLRTAPTAAVVQVMGGPAEDTVTFEIDGVAVPGTWDLDPFGNLPPTSVAVPDGTTKGEHIISVHSESSNLAGETTFTLLRNPYSALQIVGMDADPVEIPAANTSTGVRRWVLQDLMPGGLGSWVMVRNPTSMSPPEYQRTLFQEHTTAKDGQYHLSSVALQSFEWTFSGYVDTEFEQNQLLAYYGLNRRFYVMDHRARAWIVAWQKCEIVPRKRQRNDDSSFNDWAADYTVTALIYDQNPKVPR